jgi:hypothetical protein
LAKIIERIEVFPAPDLPIRRTFFLDIGGAYVLKHSEKFVGLHVWPTENPGIRVFLMSVLEQISEQICANTEKVFLKPFQNRICVGTEVVFLIWSEQRSEPKIFR